MAHARIFILMVSHSDRPDYPAAAPSKYVSYTTEVSDYSGRPFCEFWDQIHYADMYPSADSAMERWRYSGVKGVTVEVVEFMAL